jgi:alpha-amylase/alpha-mannosidase (GH57 family)
MPVTPLPGEKYRYPEDVRARIVSGINFYRNYFGRFPSGMWPPEGAVAQEILEVVTDC